MNFIKRYYKAVLFFTIVISFVLHYHVLNLDLIGIHVWRQTETQTVINNFYKEDFNILNPRINEFHDMSRIHRMEFPIMQWIFALFYKMFGPHIIVTRLLTFFIGVCSVFGMFYFCDGIFSNKGVASICAWCFSFSPVFYYYTLNPLPDNFALCCGIWSLAFLYKFVKSEKIIFAGSSAVMMGLATMAKLPYILNVVFVFVFLIVLFLKKQKTVIQIFKLSLLYIICLTPGLIWYVSVIPGWGNGTIYGVFHLHSNDPNLLSVIVGTVVSVLPELLINYAALLFFVAGLYFLFKKKRYKNLNFLPFAVSGAAFICYFLFEMNMIDLIHDYYLMIFLPFIFLIVAYGAALLLSSKSFFLKAFSLVCLFILPLTAYLRADSRWSLTDPGFNPTYLKYKDQLRKLTPKDARCVVGYDYSHYILLYYIDRKGWAFDKNHFDNSMLSYFISNGAQYIYLDENADSLPGIKDHLEQKIFDKDGVRVYKLK